MSLRKVWSSERGWRVTAIGAIAAFALATSAAHAAVVQPIKKIPFTTDFRIEECTWANQDGASNWNPYFPLVPGQRARLEGDGDVVEITVCDGSSICDGVGGDGTLVVDGVTTRVVEEREWEDGELVEVSRNYFARCERNGSVFYFGEEVDDYEGGVVVGHGGGWIAGENGASAGVVMPGLFTVGARYYQENAPGVARDRAENFRQGLTLSLAAFDDPVERCVLIHETTPLDTSELSIKRYCPGVGLVFDDGIELVEFDQP